jgi:hypothetical protein
MKSAHRHLRGQTQGRRWLIFAWVVGLALGLIRAVAGWAPATEPTHWQEVSPAHSAQAHWLPAPAINTLDLALCEECEADDEVTHSPGSARLSQTFASFRWATDLGLRPGPTLVAKVPRYLRFKQLKAHLLA